MKTKYLIQSVATGEYFARVVGHRHVMHWTEFPLLAAKFNFETLAIMQAQFGLNLPAGTYKVVAHAFRDCGSILYDSMPDAADLARFADADRRGVTGV